jgi:drug/metabolite transporter, DME family
VIAVGFALASAILFGCFPVVLRFAFRRGGDPQTGALATILVALVVAAVAALVSASWDGEVWPFLLAGLLVPGASQLLFLGAISIAGASRTSVVIGTAPLIAIVLAISLLGEPLEAPLLAGALCIVAGGIALVGERKRPPSFRRLGLLLALGAAALIASRDTLVRWLSGRSHVRPELACAGGILVGTLVIASYLAVRRGVPAVALDLRNTLVLFAPAGVMLGVSLLALYEAYYRGRVTVVSPLIATESLWGVLASVLLLRQSELVSRHVLAGAMVIVLGGALIGAFH